MRLVAFALLAALSTCPGVLYAQAVDLHGAYTFKRDSWTYVHLQGTPRQIGFAHGYLLARAIEDNVQVYRVEAPHEYKRDWPFFRETARTILWPHMDAEYQQELEGMAAGLKAQGSTLDLWDLVALNGDIEIGGYYIPTLDRQQGKPVPPEATAPGKCSAFIATGSETKGGQIVIAHSNWSSYAEGERWTVVFDIQPERGHRILMDGLPGVITSQDDFGINDAGLLITETTLPMAKGFDVNGVPEFDRSRKALQYAGTIEAYAAILRKGNNGGYANTWLIGDRKTGEVAYLELGLHHTPMTTKKSGYFVSSNFSKDPALDRDDTPGFNPNDLSSSMNARRVRATQFMQQHSGQIDPALAEAFLSDHYDSWEKKIDADKRSLCGHQDQAPVGEPVWGDAPYDPAGAVTGEVSDSAMAAKMTMTVRAGHPCGEDFHVAPFLKAHPQFAWEKPILGDMKAGPWATFGTGEAAPHTATARLASRRPPSGE